MDYCKPVSLKLKVKKHNKQVSSTMFEPEDKSVESHSCTYKIFDAIISVAVTLHLEKKENIPSGRNLQYKSKYDSHDPSFISAKH